MVIVNKERVLLIRVKKEAVRVNPGRSKNTCIHRVRSELQKALSVQFVDVDMDTPEVFVKDHNFHANRARPIDSNDPLPKI